MNRLRYMLCVLSMHPMMAMPVWDHSDRNRMIEEGWIAGQELLDFTTIPEHEIMAYMEPTAEEAALDLVVLQNVPEKHIDGYFSRKPQTFLVDPQGLVTPEQRNKLLRSLHLRANDSEIELYLYLFGSDQSIPTDVRVEEIPERLFSSGKPAVILFYHLGAPSKTVLYLSPHMTDAVSIAERGRAMDSALVKATQASGIYEPLEAFMTQISLRVYWMEKMLAWTAEESIDPKPTNPIKSAVAYREMKKSEWRWSEWSRDRIPYVTMVAAFSCGIISWLVVRKLRCCYTFPQSLVEPRLGGKHSAGEGAVLSFGTAKHRLSAQRDQISRKWG